MSENDATSEGSMCRVAQGYANRGWPVIPLHTPTPEGRCSCGKPCQSPGKHPRNSHGLKDAVTDADTIQHWWTQWTDANVGIVTGCISGLVVLDVDPRHGGDESLAKLGAQYGKLPDTPEAITGGGGRHFLFAHPGNGTILRNRAGLAELPGLDVRGDGGYIVAPPSLHVSGRRYEWELLGHPDVVPLAPIPKWLLKLVVEGPRLDGHQTSDSIGGRTPRGERNNTLFRLGCAMRRRGGSEDTVLTALLLENNAQCDPPLEEEEVRQIAASVGRYTPIDEGAGDGEWLPMCPLPAPAPSVPTLLKWIVPEPLRPWLVDVAERTCIPLEFVTCPAMVGLSNVIGRSVGIRPGRYDDWLVVPNLWGGIVARPGAMKSYAVAQALEPLKWLAVTATEQFEQDANMNAARRDRIEAETAGIKEEMKKAAKKGLNDDADGLEINMAAKKQELQQAAVTERRYMTQDATIEKLGELLRENPRGLLVYRDKLAGWLRTLDKPGREGDREFYLEGWNGTGDYTFDRIGRGTVHIDAVTVAICGGIHTHRWQSVAAPWPGAAPP